MTGQVERTALLLREYLRLRPGGGVLRYLFLERRDDESLRFYRTAAIRQRDALAEEICSMMLRLAEPERLEALERATLSDPDGNPPPPDATCLVFRPCVQCGASVMVSLGTLPAGVICQECET